MQKSKSSIIVPEPMKGKNRNNTIGLATLFAIKVADEFIKQCATGMSNDLMAYLEFLEKMFREKAHDIISHAKDGKWDITFGQDDIYRLENKKMSIAVQDAIEKLQSTNEFILSLVRLYWIYMQYESKSLKGFINWLPLYTNKL